jgi:hypothetical protein
MEIYLHVSFPLTLFKISLFFLFQWKRSVPDLRGTIITLHLKCALSLSNSVVTKCLRAKILGTWSAGKQQRSVQELGEGCCTWKLSSGNLYIFIRPNQEQLRKMQLQVPGRNWTWGPAIPVCTALRALQFSSNVNRALHRNRRVAGSIPAGDLKLHFSQLFLVRSNKCI